MAWTDKYYCEFKGLDGVLYRLSIQEDAAITSQEVKARSLPIEIKYNSAEEAIISSYSTLNLITSNTIDYTDLFTDDPMKYRVILKKAGNTIWQGYLDSEQYSRGINNVITTVKFRANDGLSLLKRKKFLDGSGNKYTDIKSYWDIIKIILQTLGITWSNIYIGTSTTSSHFTIASDKTLLHYLYKTCRNYYNNEDEPATMYDVLKSLLEEYALHIKIVNNSVYIFDYEFFYTLGAWRKYDSGFTYVSSTAYSDIGEVTAIGLRDTSGAAINVLPGKNKFSVKSTLYTVKNLIDYTASDSTIISPSSYYDITTYQSDPDYGFKIRVYSDDSYFDTSNQAIPVKYIGTGNKNNQKSENYLMFYYYTYNYNDYNNALTLLKKPYLICDGSLKYALRVQIEAYPITKVYPDNPDLKSANKINTLTLQAVVRVGGKQFTNYVNTYQWINAVTPTSDSQVYRIRFTAGDTGWIDDKVVTNEIDDTYKFKSWGIIPLNITQSGELEFNILDKFYVSDGQNLTYNYLKILFIKSIKVDLIEISTLKELSYTDRQYDGSSSLQWQNEGDTVTLLGGTNTDAIPSALGGILYFDGTNYLPATSFTRRITNIPEKLLLNTLLSEYGNKRLSITLNTNMPTSTVGLITYTPYSGKKFVISEESINIADNKVSCNLVEMNRDNNENITEI